MLFSHPGDFTPVCTTELADVSQRCVPSLARDIWTLTFVSLPRLPDFVKRDVKIIAISADSLQTHFEWIEDIIEIGTKKAPTCVEYPIVR